MDLWSKIFPNRMKTEPKKSDEVPPSPSSAGSLDAAIRPFPFCLERSGVRVVLFRDCNRSGRKVLYDSQTVHRTALPESPPHPNCSSRLFRTPLSTARSGGVPHAPSQSGVRSGSKSLPQSKTSLHDAEKVGVGRAGHPFTPRQKSWPERRKSATSDVYVEVRNGFGYQHTKGANDTKQIGELVFGCVALAFKGPSDKLHLMKNPSRIMISRTFKAPKSYRSSQASCDTGIEDSLSSFSISLSELHFAKVESLDSSSSKPLLKPSLPWEMQSSGNFGGMRGCTSEEDSGFSGPPSPYSSTCGSYLNPASLPCTPMGTPSSRSGSGSSLKSSGSLSSLQRRFLRSVATSLESFGFASIDEDRRDSLSTYQTKLGLAVIIETQQESPDVERRAEEWWFNQQEIVDNLINKLQASLKGAYLNRGKFVSSVYQAVAQLQQELLDMVYAPRLPDPLWLSLLGAESSKTKERLHSRLIDSLSCLLNNYDTKQTNFFISKLLTGVLTYHLGWVSTVGSQISTLPRKSSFSREETSTNLSDVLATYLTKTQPYNALWGQLCELTGSIGYPARVCKTVVVGTDQTLLDHLLTLLSYLIRCSQVVNNNFEVSDSNNECSMPSKSNTSSRSSFSSVTTLRESSILRTNSESEASFKCSSRSSLRYSGAKCADVQKQASSNSLIKGSSNLALCTIKVELTDQNSTNMHSKAQDSTGTEKFSPDSSLSHLNVVSSHSQPILKSGLSSSKTMSDLSAALDSSPESPSKHVPHPVKSMSSIPFHSSVYPSLLNIDDHKEAFGPLGIQPDVISEKVQKLCRVPEGAAEFKWEGKPEIKVSGEKIDLEVEKGGKVLFLLGEDQRLEGLKPKLKQKSVGGSYYDLVHIAASTSAEFKESQDHRRTSVPVTCVKALPTPVDIRRLNTVRMQGRSVSALNEKKSKTLVYPPLTELKKAFATEELPVKGLIKGCSNSTKTTVHRRNMSDPTNGAFLLEMPPYKPLPGVLEEKVEVKKSGSFLKPSDALRYSTEDVQVTPCSSSVSHEDIRKGNGETRLKREATPIEDWERIDEHSKLLAAPRVKLRPDRRSTLNVAETFLGGILDHYSPIFVLHATTHSEKLEDQLRADLYTAAQHSVLNSQISEAVAIVVETGKWEIELVSSHSYSTERRVVGMSTSSISYGGTPVMISPLVSQISDSLLNLIKIGTPSQFIIQCLEHHLRGVYLKSQLLSEYLIEGTKASLSQADSYAYLGGQSHYNTSELTHTLGIDVNDLPLLLSVASTHTPSLTQMFGCTHL